MVKEIEENLEGFEEVQSKSSSEGSSEGSSGPNRPDIRIVQTDTDKDGKVLYKNIGGMWKNISKSGNEFYTIKIGNLKLLAFPNTQK